MKNVILLLLSVFTYNAFAQTSVYHQFPDSNAIWTISAQGCCWAACPPPTITNPVVIDYHFSYTIEKDTLINGNSYHKLMHSGGTGYEHCAVGGTLHNYFNIPPSTAGFIREDIAQKKVYYLENSIASECVLYDFSLSPGDTLFGGCMNWGGPAVVDVVDSVMIGTSYRKRFSFISFSFGPYYIIEGIGSTSGLLEPIFPFEYIANLQCFSQNGQTLYPDTNSNCHIITTGIKPNPAQVTISIAPNPFSQTATISSSTPFENADIRVYNTVGQMVIHLNRISGTSFTIHRNKLPEGIYHLIINGKNQLHQQTKLLISGKGE